MIVREHYLQQIRDFYDSDLIKVITGIRRCGKSVLLETIMHEIKKTSKNVLYFNFDEEETRIAIPTGIDLINKIKAMRKDGKAYIFIDEVQELPNWANACRSLRLKNISLFITGSNSKLLSSEMASELSGRFVSLRVRPFVYRELEQYAQELKKTMSPSDYIIWGGFPKRLEFATLIDQKRYLADLNTTIIGNDVMQRYTIKKKETFRQIVNFIFLNNARRYSAHSIANYLKSHGTILNSTTVQKWIQYLESAYLIDNVKKYSVKAKRVLEQSQKVYAADVSFNSLRCEGGKYDLTHNFENVVYNELLYMGYDVTVYENQGREIDFLACKANLRYFVQVAYSVAEEKAYAREMSAFRGISQIDKKILVTMDEADFSTSNVRHVSFKDFVKLDSLDQI